MSLERWSKTYFEYLILKSKYLKKKNNNNNNIQGVRVLLCKK